MSQQGLRQASVRAVSGTTLTYEGDWHAMWDSQGIALGPFNGRMLEYINFKLGTTYANVNVAMQALAVDQGATNFSSMGTFDASTVPEVLLEADFDSDTDGFSAGTRVATEGVDFTPGMLQIGAGVTATRSFTAVSSGVFRFDFTFRATDDEVVTDDTKDHIVLLLPTAGAVTFANSITGFLLNRDSDNNATADRIVYAYLNNIGFVSPTPPTWPRGDHLVRVSFVADFAAKTFDLYFNDVLWKAGQAWSNNAAADCSRIVVLGRAAAPNTEFDNFVVTKNWVLPEEEILISDDFTARAGEIETTTPDINGRDIHSQPWHIPDNATYGGFTRGASGLTGDAAKQCLAMLRCGPEGTFEADWTLASTGTIYVGLVTRVWSGLGSDSYLLLRYNSAAAAGQELRLFRGGTALASSAGTAGSVTYPAGASRTLKVVHRGIFAWCYVAGQLQFDGAVYVGDRGQLSEEHAGPLTDRSVGDASNRCTAFRYTGRVPDKSLDLTVGSMRFRMEPGSIREFYHSGLTLDTRNLFWSKGIQNGHISTADMANYHLDQSLMIDETNIKVVRQRAVCILEDDLYGDADVYTTFLRRGIWVGDRLTYYGPGALSGGGNTPDHDFRPDLWNLSFKYIDGVGSAVSDAAVVGDDWTVLIDTTDHPKGFQTITSGSGDKLRFSGVMKHNEGFAATTTKLLYKRLGNGDPFSVATVLAAEDMAFAGEYEYGRAYFIETGSLSLDDTDLENFRDDVATPATLSFTIGAVKTDAAGDIDTDGFNERYGWHEVTCASNNAAFTFTKGVPAKRHMPVFRLNSFSMDSAPPITLDGVAAVAGTDYVIDDLGDGTAVLQLLANYTANVAVTVYGDALTTAELVTLLFDSAQKGMVYDPTDITSLYQTTDTSTPVTASGQSVGRKSDHSPNGWHALQSTAAARPLYNVASGVSSLLYDGIDDELKITTGGGLSVFQDVAYGTIIIAAKPTSVAAQKNLVSVLTIAGGMTSRMTLFKNASDQLSGGGRRLDANGFVGVTALTPTIAGAYHVLTAENDYGTAKAYASIDLGARTTTDPFQTAGNTSNTASNAVVFGSANAGAFVTGNIGRVAIIAEGLTAAKLLAAKRWASAGSGLSL